MMWESMEHIYNLTFHARGSEDESPKDYIDITIIVKKGHNLPSVRGIDIITPLPVPTHRRLLAIIREVMRTKEKPSLPVPDENK